MVAEFSLEEGAMLCVCVLNNRWYILIDAASLGAAAINFPSFGELPLKKLQSTASTGMLKKQPLILYYSVTRGYFSESHTL